MCAALTSEELKMSLIHGFWAIVAQAKFNKLGGRSQPREAKLEELSLDKRNYLLIPSSLRLLS